MHLIEKDSAAQDNETSRDQSTDVNCGDKSNPHRNVEISGIFWMYSYGLYTQRHINNGSLYN